jgi:apolipoprotein N-acyltransferase
MSGDPHRGRAGFRAWLAPAAGCVASAALLTAAQAVPGCAPLALVGLTPLAVVLDTGRFRRTWATLGAFHALYSVLTLWWICAWGWGYLWVLLLAVPYAAAVAVAPAACCRAGGLLALPAGWALMEVLLRNYLLRLTWALLGLPLADWPATARAAGQAGPEALSFLCAAVGVAAAVWLRPCVRSERVLAFAQGAGALALLVGWGLLAPAASPGEGTLRVGVIQPDVAAEQVRDVADRDAFLRRLDALIDRALPDRPDLIALPEAAFPGYVRYDDDLTAWIKRTVTRTRRPLLFGTLDHDEGDLRHVHNVAILVTPYNTVTTYKKTHPLPFGEHLPDWWPLRDQLAHVLGNTVNIYPGDEATVFRLADGEAFGVPLCSEEAVPGLGRAFAAGGARLLVSLVNTARVKSAGQGLQQLRRARLTAAAAGLPLVRCASGGPSCVVGPDAALGEVLADARGEPVLGEGAGVLAAQLGSTETPYRRYGDGPALALFGGVVVAATAWRHRNRFRPAPGRRVSRLPVTAARVPSPAVARSSSR